MCRLDACRLCYTLEIACVLLLCPLGGWRLRWLARRSSRPGWVRWGFGVGGGWVELTVGISKPLNVDILVWIFSLTGTGENGCDSALDV